MRALVVFFGSVLLFACSAVHPRGDDGGLDGAIVVDGEVIRPDGGPHDLLDGGGTDAGVGTGGDDGGMAPRDAGSGPGTGEQDAGSIPCDRTRVDTSSPPENASWRFGGGVGYPDRPPSVGDCVTRVTTRAELEAALASARAGDVVFLPGDVRIDLTGASLCIPGGVTLASDRGLDGSAGALLYVTRTESRATLRACGDDVRITGLRLFGHEPTECPVEWSSPGRVDCTGDITGATNCRDCMPRSRGIRATDVDRLEVDNCELAGWTYGAIELIRSHDNHVHHNNIHHNQRQGLGYGVVISGIGNPGDVVIDHNRFDYNRHSVAASGAIGQSYVAHHNLVLEHANGHVFDMHGISESGSYDPAVHGPEDVAGTNMRIYANTVLPPDYRALVVRGRPTEGSWLYDNCLARRNASEAALQRRYTGRFYVDRSPSGSAPNRYGQSASDCLPLRFCSSAGGAGPWQYLARSSYGIGSLGFADFDGDGITDVFRTDGSRWMWLRSGYGSWAQLNASSAQLNTLRFGDFDGDGKADVFRATGSRWEVSYGGTGRWTTLRTTTDTLSSLAFGDFDGDGKTDVFRTTGSQWQVSYGGTSAWTRLISSSVTLGSLAFADFDGDGKTDVLRTRDGEWLVSYGGQSSWTTLNRSNVGVSAMRFADVDGDGKDDIIHFTGSRWNVSYGGRTGWQTLAFRSERDVVFHDFDGDGRADAFRTGCL